MLACLTILGKNWAKLILRFAVEGWLTPGACAEVLKRKGYISSETIPGLQSRISKNMAVCSWGCSKPPINLIHAGPGPLRECQGHELPDNRSCRCMAKKWGMFWPAVEDISTCVLSRVSGELKEDCVCWLCVLSPRSRAALHSPWPQSDITCWPTLVQLLLSRTDFLHRFSALCLFCLVVCGFVSFWLGSCCDLTTTCPTAPRHL